MAGREKKRSSSGRKRAGFTLERLKAIASAEVMLHGRELVNAPGMLKRLKDGNELSCMFYLDGRQIRCSVDARRHSLQELCTCDAPYFCRHSVALVLTWLEHPDTFLDLDRWLDDLDRLPKHELAEMLRRMVGRYPASSLEALGIAGFDPAVLLEKLHSDNDDLLADLLDEVSQPVEQNADAENSTILPGWLEELEEDEDDDPPPGRPGKPIN
ncbi:MAG: hypothetical protein FJ109_12995 [Deltaproteobacteria bacterium]|nr:hypothetical protein [Deltaproteobacteria bacterium]